MYFKLKKGFNVTLLQSAKLKKGFKTTMKVYSLYAHSSGLLFC